MVVRKALAAVALTAGVVAAANVTLNIKMDDTGTVYLNGAEVYTGKLEGASVPVNVLQGDNVLGVWVHDAGYQAGFAASIDLNECGTADTVITDGTWRASDDAPEGWATVGFDASSWLPAGVCQVVPDNDTVPAEHALFSHGARWLWTPHKVYMRKKFTAEMDTVWTVAIVGSGFSYRLLLDGTLVGEQADMQTNNQTDQFTGKRLSIGDHVLAVEATCLDTVNTAWLQAGLITGRGATATRMAVTDSTWKYSFTEVSGWDGVAFDDAAWKNLGHKQQAMTGPFTGGYSFVWPNNMYFRCLFNVPTAGVKGTAHAAMRGSRVASRAYYTLQGQRLDESALRSQGGLVIERAQTVDGKVKAQVVQGR